MEFPDDVLTLIREYSKPFFRYRKEYEDALLVFNLTEWKDLKRKLHGPNAKEVCTAMIAFKDSRMEENDSRDEEYRILYENHYVSFEEKWIVHKQATLKTDALVKLTAKTHREMLRLMYGGMYS